MSLNRWRMAGLTSLVMLISSSAALPLVADGCSGVAAYVSGTVYTGGQQVVYNSQLWTAKWWTQNETPSSAGSGVWQYVSDCSGGGTTTTPAGYTWCANENASYTFNQTVDVAYGANGVYVYKTGVSGAITFNNATFGDPISGVAKAGYYKASTAVGPAGYTWCAGENGAYTFNQTVDVAYGANGAFVYKTGVTGAITFNNATFGDPISGVAKAGYYKASAGVGPAGYAWCASENGSYTFSQAADVAYGANGSFAYKTGVTGAVSFNNATFGDPISGVVKAGYYKNSGGGGATGNLTLGQVTNPNGRFYAGYYPSWSDNWFSVTNWDGTKMTDDQIYTASHFANMIPGVITHVMISFGQPNFSWGGMTANNWSGTGVNFNCTPADMKEVIRLLHILKKKVILAVGGATYNSWGALSAEAGSNGPTKTALTQFMVDLGVDGLDVDYEQPGVDATSITNYAHAIQAMREACDAAGAGHLLTIAAWSTGADYTAATGAGPLGTSYWGGDAGRERQAFAKTCTGGSRSGQKIGSIFDVVNVMSYDAQTYHYDPATAYDEYRALVPAGTPVSIGLEIPPEGWAGGNLTLNSGSSADGSFIAADQYGRTGRGSYSVERFGNYVKNNTVNANPHDGLMLWQILKTTSPTDANATSASDKVANMFGYVPTKP